MAIRFLRQWNGYDDQDIATLSAAEESRLVSAGIATFNITAEKSGMTLDEIESAIGGGSDKTNISYIICGGDHADSQYRYGKHRLALTRGIPWYIAINTDGDHVSPGIADNLTWQELLELQGQGVEIINHGAEPHCNSWKKLSTGIRVRYTGNGTAASIDITGDAFASGAYPGNAKTVTATVTGSSDGSVGFTLDLTAAPYDTIGEVVAYINTRTGWDCVSDVILNGTESSRNLARQSTKFVIPSGDVTSATISGSEGTLTITNNGFWPDDQITLTGFTPSDWNGTHTVTKASDTNVVKFNFAVPPSGNATVMGTVTRCYRPLALGCGIYVRYNNNGAKYKRVHLQFASFNIVVYGDGVQIGLAVVGATTTMAATVSALNALNITGLSFTLHDDRRADGVNTAKSYMHGGEYTGNIEYMLYKDVSIHPQNINAGIPVRDIAYKRMKKTYDTALTNGVKLTNFATAGTGFEEYLLAANNGLHDELRIVSDERYYSANPIGTRPVSMLPSNAHYVFEPNATNYVNTAARINAFIDALATSSGFLTDFLCHGFTPDGSSGITFPADNTEDLSESVFIAALDRIKYWQDQGRLLALSPKQFSRMRGAIKPAANMLFNPQFKNSGESLPLGLTTISDANANNGQIVPGVIFTTPAHVTATSITNDQWLFTTNAATSFIPIQWQGVLLKRGVQYEFGISAEVIDRVSGHYYISIESQMGQWDTYQGSYLFPSIKQSEQNQKTTTVMLPFRLPNDVNSGGEVRSLVGPYNVPTGTSKLRFEAGTYITGINLAGAVPATTKANEVAQAINTAVNAAVTAGTYDYIYRDPATVINGQVVIRDPLSRAEGASIDIGTETGDQLTSIFGHNSISARVNHSDPTGEVFPVKVRVYMVMQGTAKFFAPYLREVSN